MFTDTTLHGATKAKERVMNKIKKEKEKEKRRKKIEQIWLKKTDTLTKLCSDYKSNEFTFVSYLYYLVNISQKEFERFDEDYLVNLAKKRYSQKRNKEAAIVIQRFWKHYVIVKREKKFVQ